MVSGWLHMGSPKSLKDKFSNPYDTNEHVCCLMDDNLEYGVIVCAVYNNQDRPDPEEAPGKDRKKYADGTVIEYDRNTHIYTIDAKGPVIIKAAPAVTITGNVIVSGTLTAAAIATSGTGGTISAPGGSISANNVNASVDVKAGTISLKTHVHSGAQTGPGVTGVPV